MVDSGVAIGYSVLIVTQPDKHMQTLIEAIDGRSDMVIVVTRDGHSYFRADAMGQTGVKLADNETVVESYATGAQFVVRCTGRTVSMWGYKDAVSFTIHSIDTVVIDGSVWGVAGDKFGTVHTRLANVVG